MRQQQTIVTLTLNPAIDKSSRVNSVASEIKLRCEQPTFDPGGGGINVSRAVQKLGGASTAYYAAGGHSGVMLQDLLHAEGIPQQILTIAGMTRENFTVYEETSGLQYRFGMPGAPLTSAEWQQSITDIAAHDSAWVVASGSLPPGVPTDYYAQLTEAVHASKGDSRVIVDTSGEPLMKVAYRGVFLIKPNLNELEQISGKKFAGVDQLQDVAHQLLKDGLADVLVISMGAGGAALITQDDFVTLRPPVVPIQSKVGAGDSMVGGMVLALARGDDLVDAARWGVAAGSAAVMTPGTELCRREDAERIYAQTTVMPA